MDTFNRICIAVTVMLLVAAILQYAGILLSGTHELISLFALAKLSALIFLLTNGTFFSGKRKNVLIFLSTLGVLSFALKVLHLPYADLCLVLSDISAMILYSVHFYYKENKTIADHSKLLTALSLTIAPTLLLLHALDGLAKTIAIYSFNGMIWVSLALVIVIDLPRKKGASSTE
jgi:hypothetical protein